MINNDTISSMTTDTETFRQKVIDAGIQGKLTEQLPEDGNAEDLYQQIQEEKAKLVKEGKIKKSKPLPSIKPEEIPFEIPENWKWVRLGDLFDHNTGKALNSSDKDGSLLTYITTSNVYWDHFELNNLKSMYFNESEIDKCTIQKGDLLICEGGDIGRSAIWPYKQEIRIQNHLHRLRPFLSEQLNVKFYYYVMWSYKLNGLINGRGIGLQGFSSKRVHSLIVPFPPVTEQKRIIDRIDEILGIQKHLAKSLEEYSTNVDALKSKVIDAGIQGRLTEQLPEDGTAQELFERIQKEKARLVKEGKIKEQKPLPPIKPEEIPFGIPENWMWVRLGEICTKLVDGDHNPPKGVTEKTDYLMLSAQNILNDRIDNLNSVRFLSEEVFKSENKRTNLCEGDVLLTIVGTLGRSCVFEGGMNCCFQRSVSVMTPVIDSYYLKRVFDSGFVQSYMNLNATGSAQIGFYLNQLEKLLVPLPPLAEQKRIAERIEEILGAVGE